MPTKSKSPHLPFGDQRTAPWYGQTLHSHDGYDAARSGAAGDGGSSVLADEINRASPKTQSALLEAMQERQVTLEGETLSLSEPFLVFATQNPIEYEGTFPLPEAQLDRFMLYHRLDYPTPEQERDIHWSLMG